MHLKDPKSIEEALRNVLRSGQSTTRRTSDGTKQRFYRYDSNKVNDLIKELKKQLPELVENAKKPSLEEIERLKSTIDAQKKVRISYDLVRIEHLEQRVKELEAEYETRTDIYK